MTDRSGGDRPPAITEDELAATQEIVGRLTRAYDAKLVGQRRLRTALLVSLVAEGHILVESVPGLAKTTAAQTLAATVNATFARIQCTPDLLPSDIIGTQVYDPSTTEFRTRLGPVHANFVLLDEINRASAKTQSAMLEAMQEGQTTIGGEPFALPAPFMVLATQNPIEEEGTYPLPHAQLDRFLLKEIIDYPTSDEEYTILDRVDRGVLGPRAEEVEAVLDLDDVALLIGAATKVYVDDSIKRYCVALAQATRQTRAVIGPALAAYVEAGVSPRGAIALQQVARAYALVHGRAYVSPDDVRALAHAVLRHRLRLTFQAVADEVGPDVIIDAVIGSVRTP